MGAQKDHLNEKVLLKIQNICLNWWVRKYLQFYTENFCLSKPVAYAINTNLISWLLKLCYLHQIPWFVWLYSLHPSQQFFSYVGIGLPGLNQYYAGIDVFCSRTQCSATGEDRTPDLSFLSQALYHCIPTSNFNIDFHMGINLNSLSYTNMSNQQVFCHISRTQCTLKWALTFIRLITLVWVDWRCMYLHSSKHWPDPQQDWRCMYLHSSKHWPDPQQDWRCMYLHSSKHWPDPLQTEDACTYTLQNTDPIHYRLKMHVLTLFKTLTRSTTDWRCMYLHSSKHWPDPLQTEDACTYTLQNTDPIHYRLKMHVLTLFKTLTRSTTDWRCMYLHSSKHWPDPLQTEDACTYTLQNTDPIHYRLKMHVLTLFKKLTRSTTDWRCMYLHSSKHWPDQLQTEDACTYTLQNTDPIHYRLKMHVLTLFKTLTRSTTDWRCMYLHSSKHWPDPLQTEDACTYTLQNTDPIHYRLKMHVLTLFKTLTRSTTDWRCMYLHSSKHWPDPLQTEDACTYTLQNTDPIHYRLKMHVLTLFKTLTRSTTDWRCMYLLFKTLTRSTTDWRCMYLHSSKHWPDPLQTEDACTYTLQNTDPIHYRLKMHVLTLFKTLTRSTTDWRCMYLLFKTLTRSTTDWRCMYLHSSKHWPDPLQTEDACTYTLQNTDPIHYRLKMHVLTLFKTLTRSTTDWRCMYLHSSKHWPDPLQTEDACTYTLQNTDPIHYRLKMHVLTLFKTLTRSSTRLNIISHSSSGITSNKSANIRNGTVREQWSETYVQIG